MRELGTAWREAHARGDFGEAWRIADIVLDTRDKAGRDDPALPYHQRWVWDGREFAGRNVLVRCYHGLGDTLQFARFLPLLARQARRLEVETQPELLPLLAQIPGVVRWHAFDPARPLPPAECDIEIMEIPHALRATPLLTGMPYLRAEPDPQLPARIGVCLRAGSWDAERSVPPALLESTLAELGCLSLEPGPARFPAANREGCPETIEGTARWVAGLDLVITVDTMIAHLAGALGRPVWLLLKHAPDWRWMNDAGVAAWYPATVPLRQQAPGDWSGPVRLVAAALRSVRG